MTGTEMTTAEADQSLVRVSPPRLPYPPAVQEKFEIDPASWKALVEAVFPNAGSHESVILALSYCKARNLDPFKNCVHIVPIWDKKLGKMVDTVWPGIGELRTTAFRTHSYAGRDATVFGPDITKEFNGVSVTFPEFAQITLHRIVKGNVMTFAGPPVYWEETFASLKGGAPNSMWKKRPKGQLDKCAEAAALRCAFPEELGDDYTEDEIGFMVHASGGLPGVAVEPETPRPTKETTPFDPFAVFIDELGDELGTFNSAKEFAEGWLSYLADNPLKDSEKEQLKENNRVAIASIKDRHPDAWSLIGTPEPEATPEQETSTEADNANDEPAGTDEAHIEIVKAFEAADDLQTIIDLELEHNEYLKALDPVTQEAVLKLISKRKKDVHAQS